MKTYALVNTTDNCILAVGLSEDEAMESKACYSENFPGTHFEVMEE